MANVTFFSPDGGVTRYPIEDTEARSRIETAKEQVYADNGVLGAKNLLKITSNTQTINGVTFTINRDSNGNVLNVTVNGTATANINFRLIPYDDIDLNLLTNKTLLLSGCPSGGGSNAYGLEVYYNDGQEHWFRDYGDGVEISIPSSGLTNINPNIMVRNGATVNNLVFYPMLRLASDPDDTYQPYAMTNRELTEVVETKVLATATANQTFESQLATLKAVWDTYSYVQKMRLCLLHEGYVIWYPNNTSVFGFTGYSSDASGFDMFVVRAVGSSFILLDYRYNLDGTFSGSDITQNSDLARLDLIMI